MTELAGKCLCGAVRFRVLADPLAVRVCWCRDCQHIAANGTVNVTVPTTAVEVSGELRDFTSVADSGNRVLRRFCPVCGTHLFAGSSARPHLTVVRVGNLDDPSCLRPTTNIWAASAPSWACIDDSLERVEHQPAPPQPSPPK